ncbi:MAG: vWA domain-containing protein [Bradymonadia bacterium]
MATHHPAHTRTRRGAQKGAMSITVVQACLILAAMSIAAIAVGRVALQSMELDNGSDAVALTCLQIAKLQGLNALDNGNHTAVANVAQANSRSGTVINPNCDRLVRTDDGRLAIGSSAAGNYVVDQELVKNNGQAVQGDLNAAAVGSIYQYEVGNFELPEPELILVLDYSGSMAQNFGGQRRIDALRFAVNEMLDVGSDIIAFGLVMFDAAVSRAIEPEFDPDQDIIRSTLDSRDAGGRTNYADPLSVAIDMLPRNNDNTPGYILFVGDGQPIVPNAGEARTRAIQQARRAWDAGYTIFTLNVGGQGQHRDLLFGMAGDQNLNPNPNYYFEADNLAQLRAAFGAIEESLLCKVGPIEPRPPTCDGIHVFIREGDIELKLEQVPNAGDRDVADARVFELICDPAGNEPVQIRMNRRTCNQLVDEGGNLVVRYGKARLIAEMPDP